MQFSVMHNQCACLSGFFPCVIFLAAERVYVRCGYGSRHTIESFVLGGGDRKVLYESTDEVLGTVVLLGQEMYFATRNSTFVSGYVKYFMLLCYN